MDYIDLPPSALEGQTSAKLLSTLAGIDIVPVKLRDLPDYEALRATEGESLRARGRRTFSLYRRLQKAHVSFPAATVRKAAAARFADAFQAAHHEVAVGPQAHDVPEDVRSVSGHRLEPGQDMSQRFLSWACWGEAQPHPELRTADQPEKALLVVSDHEDARRVWARMIGVTADRVPPKLEDGLHNVFFSVRNLVRATQVEVAERNRSLEPGPLRYYCAFFADLVAHASLSRLGLGEQTRKGVLNSSFVNLLRLPEQPEDYTAPLLELTFTKKEPANYRVVRDAVAEIGLRIFFEQENRPHRDIPSYKFMQELNARDTPASGNPFFDKELTVQGALTAYKGWSRKGFETGKPYLLFNSLADLHKTRAFSGMAALLVPRILEAAAAINPDWIAQVPRPRKRFSFSKPRGGSTGAGPVLV